MSKNAKHAKKVDHKLHIHLAIIVVATLAAIGASFITSAVMVHLSIAIPGASEGIRVFLDVRKFDHK